MDAFLPCLLPGALGVPLSEYCVIQWLFELAGIFNRLTTGFITDNEGIGAEYASGVHLSFDFAAPYIIIFGVVRLPHIMHIGVVVTCPKPTMIRFGEYAMSPNALRKVLLVPFLRIKLGVRLIVIIENIEVITDSGFTPCI